MMLACAYARCSTDEQAGSLPAQWSQIEQYAKRYGYKIVERYEDDSISGTEFRRPGLQSLVQAAEHDAKWSYVLVWDRSRLGRPEDPREALAVTYSIERHGKKIIPLHGAQHGENPLLNTITEALEFGQAGEESIRKSRDVLRGQRESAVRGSIPAGKVPYGYDALYLLNQTPLRRIRYLADGSKDVLSVDGIRVLEHMDKDSRIGKSTNESLVLIPGSAQEVDVVKRIFREYNSGLSPRSIAHELNSLELPSPRGKDWGRTTIVRVLQNPAYKGVFCWNKIACGRFHAVQEEGEIVRKSNPDKRWSANPEKARVTHEGIWEGIVSVKEWNDAQSRLSNTCAASALHGKGTHSNFLASTLMECICGSHFAGSSFDDKRRPGVRYEYYRCLGAQDRGRTVCNAKRIRREIIDDYLESRLHEIYFIPSMQGKFWKQLSRELDELMESIAQPSTTDAIYADLQEVNARIDRLVEAVADGVLDLKEVESKLNPLRAKKLDLESRVQSANAVVESVGNLRNLRSRVLDACKERLAHSRELWPNATPFQRKQIVRAHVASIKVDQPKSEIVTTFYPLLNGTEFGIPATTC